MPHILKRTYSPLNFTHFVNFNQGNVRRYRRILRNRLNENDPEDQQDDGETMPVKIKYLKIGRVIGLETPFSITEETEQNQEGANALKIVKEFL